jgi:hypothetical protein
MSDDPNQQPQAYSQAIPTQQPRPHAYPDVYPGAADPRPARRGDRGRNVLVGLFAVASAFALILTITLVALASNNKHTDNTPTPVALKVGDCLYGLGQTTTGSPSVGNCQDGGSPYKVLATLPRGGSCPAGQAVLPQATATLCLAPNLNADFCYTTPGVKDRQWILPAVRCGDPDTITVISVVQGARDSSRCTGDWDKPYYFTNPLMTVCVKQF